MCLAQRGNRTQGAGHQCIGKQAQTMVCLRRGEMASLSTAARHQQYHPHLPVQVALGCNRVLQPLKMDDSPLQAQGRGLVGPPSVHSSGQWSARTHCSCPCAVCLQLQALLQATSRGKAAHRSMAFLSCPPCSAAHH